MKHNRGSNKVKQRQLQTKYLQQQTKKMQQKLNQLKKQVQQQKQLKTTSNFQSTVSRWKKATRSDAPLKSYAKQILQQQKQAYKKFGVDEKKITGTMTFSNIKKKLKQQKQQEQERYPKKIPVFLQKTGSMREKQADNVPVESIQNNFFKAKMDVKNLIKQKTVLQFLQQIFLQHYYPVLQQNQITELEDLRFLTRQQLDQMGLAKGHQVKILKTIKEQFDKGKTQTKMYEFPKLQQMKSHIQQPNQKKMIDMGYGEGNINDYVQIEAQEEVAAEEDQFIQLQQNFEKADSQTLSQGLQSDFMLITLPLIQMALQTGDDYQNQGQIGESINQNCFNCYKSIPLSNDSFRSPDNRNFCSQNCLRIYKLQMQKTCPQCSNLFFKTNGYYQQGLWFCSIGCCPNKEEIEQMFMEWTKKEEQQY